MNDTALLLIAHGSRRAQANADLEYLAEIMRSRGRYIAVQPAYLELCEPTILQGGARCVEAGARRVVMMPYFLSAGVHVVEDMTEARDQLHEQFPSVEFVLTEHLGRHPLLAEIVMQRVDAVTATATTPLPG